MAVPLREVVHGLAAPLRVSGAVAPAAWYGGLSVCSSHGLIWLGQSLVEGGEVVAGRVLVQMRRRVEACWGVVPVRVQAGVRAVDP